MVSEQLDQKLTGSGYFELEKKISMCTPGPPKPSKISWKIEALPKQTWSKTPGTQVGSSQIKTTGKNST
jgi:hypothetical protein